MRNIPVPVDIYKKISDMMFKNTLIGLVKYLQGGEQKRTVEKIDEERTVEEIDEEEYSPFVKEEDIYDDEDAIVIVEDDADEEE